MTSPSGTGSADASTSDSSGMPGTLPDEVGFLRIDPQETLLQLDIGEAGEVPLTVYAQRNDGTEVDITADVTWEVVNPEVGTMEPNGFVLPARNESFFASTVITARTPELAAQAQVTVAAYRKTGEITDFFFVLPHQDDNGPQVKPLTFSTGVKSLDVFFSMDTTSSMAGAIRNLKTSLTASVIPEVRAQVPDTQFGVGAFEDFPVAGYGTHGCYGTASDQPFELLQAVTPDVDAVLAGVNALSRPTGEPIGCGGDGPESNVEALYQVATGEGLTGPSPTSVAAHDSGVGGVGFRESSMPVVVAITDAPSHNFDDGTCPAFTGGGHPYSGAVADVAHSSDETIAALNSICARVVQIATASYDCSALTNGVALATGTGALIPPDAWDRAANGRPPGCGAGQCCTGVDGGGVAPNQDGVCPLAYLTQPNGNGVSAGLTDGIRMLAAYAPFDVSTAVSGVDTDVEGEPLPAGVNTADFIVAVTPVSHGPVPLPGVPDPTISGDRFLDVIPDTPVTFDVRAFNRQVPEAPSARLFKATIRVLAGGCSELDERDVFILVPPAALPPAG